MEDQSMIESEKTQPQHDEERLERMVQTRTSELSELASYLHKAREDERRDLARELHDELGSYLTAAKLDLAFIKSRCAKAQPELVAKCDRIAAMLDQGTAFKRRVIENLRPSTLDLLGLAPAVRELVEKFAAEFRIRADANIDSEIAPGTDDALVVFRIVEEALRNVGRHAQASKVEVTLARPGDLIRICVRDNGKGFGPLTAPKPAGYGLAAMRERVRVMGGKLSVVSSPGSGTEVEAWLPFRPG